MNSIINQSVIESTRWIKNMQSVPKTVSHIDLLAFFLDKLDITNQYDISFVSGFDANRIDIFYGALRLINHYFCAYNEYCFSQIFEPYYQNAFGENYDLLYDQLIQDSEYFVSYMIKKFALKLDHDILKMEYTNYLNSIIKFDYYQKFISMDNSVEKKLFRKKKINSLINNLITSSGKYLNDIYELSNDIIKTIFSPITIESNKSIDKIFASLINNNIDEIIDSECIEIDMYYEELINENDDSCINENFKLNRSMEFMNNHMQNNIIHSGYNIVNTYHSSDYTESILAPFIFYNMAKSSNILINKILKIMKERKLLVKNSNIELFYQMLNTNITYDDVIKYIDTTNKFPDNCPIEFIYRLLSNILDINIRLFDSTMFILKTSPEKSDPVRSINVYMVRFNNRNIITLCLEKQPKITKSISKPESIHKVFSREYY